VGQISAPVRIVALVGMLAALAMGAWMMSAGMRGGSADTAVESPTALLAPVAQANAVAGKLSAHNKATAAGKTDKATAAKPKTAAAAKPKTTAAKPKPTAAKPKPTAAKVTPPAAAKPAVVPVSAPSPKKLPAGTPNSIGSLLNTHGVVVVLLYNPRAKVDSYSLGEAALGAKQASAGFLRVDVLNQHQAAPFMKAYGVLQDPTLLFFVRPGKLVHKHIGFADHETVAQAAINEAVKAGWVPTQAQRSASAAAVNDLASWSAKANAICVSNQVPGRQPLSATATDAEATTYIRGFQTQMSHVITGLSALPLPSSASKRALISSYIGSIKKMRVDFESTLQARLEHNVVASRAGFAALAQDAAKQQSLEGPLGLTECG
jgi:hypothetical protein